MNYETLVGKDHNIFFLFKTKCPVIARDIGSEVGQTVVCQNRRKNDAGARGSANQVEPRGGRRESDGRGGQFLRKVEL